MGPRSRGTIRYPALRIRVHTLCNDMHARVCGVCEELLPVIPRTGLSHESGVVNGHAAGTASDVEAYSFSSSTILASWKNKGRFARVCAIDGDFDNKTLRPFVGEEHRKVTPVRLRFAKDTALIANTNMVVNCRKSVSTCINLSCRATAKFYFTDF